MNEETAQKLHGTFNMPAAPIARWVNRAEGLRLQTTPGYVGYKVWTTVLKMLRRLAKNGVLMRDGTHFKALVALAMNEHTGYVDTLSDEELLSAMDAPPMAFPFIEDSVWRERRPARVLAKLPRTAQTKSRSAYVRVISKRMWQPSAIDTLIGARDAKVERRVREASVAATMGAHWQETLRPLREHIERMKRLLDASNRSASYAERADYYAFMDRYTHDLLVPLLARLDVLSRQGPLRVMALREGAPNHGYAWCDWLDDTTKARWSSELQLVHPRSRMRSKLFARPLLNAKNAPFRHMLRQRVRDMLYKATQDYTALRDVHTKAGRHKQAAVAETAIRAHTRALEAINSYTLDMPMPIGIAALLPKEDKELTV